MKKSTTLFLIILILVISKSGFSQHEQKIDSRNPQAMMKASFLFQFAKQNKWPSTNTSSPFIIAVYGNHDIYNYLSEKYATQPIGSQTLKIVEITTNSEFKNASIVFVDQSKMNDFELIKRHFSNQNTMLVTDNQGALSRGAIINFIRKNSQLKIEINNKEAIAKNIGIGKILLKWSVNN